MTIHEYNSRAPTALLHLMLTVKVVCLSRNTWNRTYRHEHPSHGWCRMYTSKRGASCGVTLFPAFQSRRTKERFAVILWLRRIKRLCGSFSCLACSSVSLGIPAWYTKRDHFVPKPLITPPKRETTEKKTNRYFLPLSDKRSSSHSSDKLPDANESSHSATKLPDANAPLDDPYNQRSMTPNQNAEAAFVPIF